MPTVYAIKFTPLQKLSLLLLINIVRGGFSFITCWINYLSFAALQPSIIHFSNNDRLAYPNIKVVYNDNTSRCKCKYTNKAYIFRETYVGKPAYCVLYLCHIRTILLCLMCRNAVIQIPLIRKTEDRPLCQMKVVCQWSSYVLPMEFDQISFYLV